MTNRPSFKAPQKSLKSSWKGVESFKQVGRTVQAIKVTQYSKGTRKHITTSHWGEKKGSDQTGYQY